MNIVAKARIFAKKVHRGQLDDTGKPYIVHPEQVAQILGLITSDDNVVAAGWLHDTAEDCGVTHEELVKEFNQDVADLVFEVTHEGKKDSIGYYFPRLHSQRGIIIKLADRLSNVSRMQGWDEKRRQAYLRKTKFWRSQPNE